MGAKPSLSSGESGRDYGITPGRQMILEGASANKGRSSRRFEYIYDDGSLSDDK